MFPLCNVIIGVFSIMFMECQTSVFLMSCSFQASSQEGAAKVYELLQGKAFRSVGWITLFDCLTIYDEKFKQSLQTAGAILPEFQEGDAKALVAYLNVLQKVLTFFVL